MTTPRNRKDAPMRLRQHVTTIAVAVACIAVAAALPVLAHGVEHALFAHDSGKLDGRDSTAYQRDLGRVITVAKSGGDFTSVTAALQTITDSNTNRRYIVRVGPGVFSAETLQVPSFVTLEGAGPEATVLAMDSAGLVQPPAVAVETDATVRALTVSSEDNHRTAISAGARARIEQVSVDFANGGIGVSVIGRDVEVDDVVMDISGVAGSSYGVYANSASDEHSVSVERSVIAVEDETAAAVRASGDAASMFVRWSQLSGASSGSKTAALVSTGATLYIASSELDDHVSGSVTCRDVWTAEAEAAADQCPQPVSSG